MIHYHGGPITPDPCGRRAWKGRHAFVSSAHRQQVAMAIAITQSFALDNGAYSLWKAGKPIDWRDYYDWVAGLRHHPRFDFAVVPDVIEGTEGENDALADAWPFDRNIGAVVWHTNESVERLVRLAYTWPRVAIGSSGEYDVRQPERLVQRMLSVLPYIVDSSGYPVCKLHGLRMLNPAVFTRLPLKSADSTNIARNFKMDVKWKGGYQPATPETRIDVLVDRIEASVSASSIFEGSMT